VGFCKGGDPRATARVVLDEEGDAMDARRDGWSFGFFVLFYGFVL
jgi:hypothetical protein